MTQTNDGTAGAHGLTELPCASSPSWRWRVALHEAGHVAAARVYCLPCHGAFIVDGGGITLYRRGANPQVEAVIHFIGGTAEELVTRYAAPRKAASFRERVTAALMLVGRGIDADCLQPIDSELTTSDDMVIVHAYTRTARRLNRRRRRIGRVMWRTTEIVRQHEAEIVRIACALFTRGMITGEEIGQLCTGAM